MERIKRILIVEDERKIAEALQMGLRENEYEIVLAFDGEAGYSLFTSNAFQLIVLDINLPLLNGLELCKRIRKSNQDIPIILLTAMSSLNNKIEGYNVGADDYLCKPFEFQELLMKIRVLLKRTELPINNTLAILKVGDLEMNLENKEVYRKNQKINLTSKEFQLLEFLLRNKNKLLSRKEIAVNVWGIDFDTNTNVIDVYINYLRNKVDKPFEFKLIHTHVGAGYILKAN